ncbi:MAG: hypothetical protein IPN18_10040 [Ignavibacteriales bacterium]|nr:hypothetical protein [Ignavibacteriales bacterium]
MTCVNVVDIGPALSRQINIKTPPVTWILLPDNKFFSSRDVKICVILPGVRARFADKSCIERHDFSPNSIRVATRRVSDYNIWQKLFFSAAFSRK